MALVASALLHIVVAWTVLVLHPLALVQHGSDADHEVQVEIVTRTPAEPRASAAPAAPEPAAPEPVAPATRAARPQRAVTVVAADGWDHDGEPGAAAPAAQPEPAVVAATPTCVERATGAGAETCVAPDTSRPRVPWAAIDPTAAAVTLADAPGRPATGAEARAPAGRSDRARSAEISDALRVAAVTERYLGHRSAPELRRRTDGTYHYESSQFNAVIRADGRVSFSDRPLGMPAPGVFTFDFNDAMMQAHGEDPYQYERQWFMDSTRTLRERLSAAADQTDTRQALRRLRARLARIWADPSVPAARRREMLFTLWDDCADDAIGREARHTVERFIRRVLPRGSADAFSREEIARLDARRVSPVPFAPYG